MPPKQELYAVRRPFDRYGELFGDRGAVFPLAGAVQDERLVRLGYLELVIGKQDIVECGECGQRFISGQFRDAHGDKRHRRYEEPLDVAAGGAPALDNFDQYSPTGISGTMLSDVTGDREEQMLEREAPIYWEKTAASQRG